MHTELEGRSEGFPTLDRQRPRPDLARGSSRRTIAAGSGFGIPSWHGLSVIGFEVQDVSTFVESE